MSALTSSTMPRRLPPGCIEDRDRHGNIRIYYRAKGRLKVRLRGTPWTDSFMAEYEAAKGQTAPVKGRGVVWGTWRWLCVRYFTECADYLRLDDRTKRVRRGILEATFDEPIAPGSPKLFRDFPLSRMTTDAIEVLRIERWHSRREQTIASRQSGLSSDGKPYAPRNPARDVPYFKTGSTG